MSDKPCPVHDVKPIHRVVVGVAVIAFVVVMVLVWKVGVFQF